MSDIDLKLSNAAKEQLLQYISEIEYENPVTSVMWHEGGERRGPDGEVSPIPPGWGVGWYDVANLSGEPTQEIEGIQFVFGQGKKSEELNGKMLDVKDGVFVIIEAAKCI